MTSCASKCPAELIRWQKSVGAHQNPAHTSPTHLSTHSYPTLISKKHHMLTSREKCGLATQLPNTIQTQKSPGLVRGAGLFCLPCRYGVGDSLLLCCCLLCRGLLCCCLLCRSLLCRCLLCRCLLCCFLSCQGVTSRC